MVSFTVAAPQANWSIDAFDTSAPEVALSIGAVLDGNTNIAMGHVMRGNIFDVRFILGISVLITPLVVSVHLIRQKVSVRLGVSLLLLPLSLDGNLSLTEGSFLFALLVAYTVYLALQSRRETCLILTPHQHAALQTFSGVMQGSGVPLTVVTLAVVILRPNNTGQR